MEIRYLNTFKAILETGSFQNAALRLSCTQSTVTFQIQQLEQELSVKLFERIGRRMVITQAGRDILPFADTILLAAQQLADYGKEINQITGTLKISMPETLITYKMQPVLSEFRRQAPGVRLSVQALDCYSVRRQIISGADDLGIHYDIGGYSDSFIVEELSSFPLVLIASPSLDEKLSDFTAAKQQKDICLITNDRERIFQMKLESYLKEKNIVLDGVMELGSTEAVKRSTASNLGIACLPEYAAEAELADGTLKELKTEITDNMVTAVCAYHKNKWVSPAMSLFIELLKENLQNK